MNCLQCLGNRDSSQLGRDSIAGRRLQHRYNRLAECNIATQTELLLARERSISEA
jgi:hypothetical protein